VIKKYLPYSAMILSLMLLSACQPASEAKESLSAVHTPVRDTPVPSLLPVESTITVRPTPLIIIRQIPGETYETILSIPAGNEELPYRGVGMPGMEITGPDAFAISPDGNWVIADLIGNRIQIYNPAGQIFRTIDLYALGILNVADLQVYGDELYVLEIYLGPPLHYRINHLSYGGDLISYYDIPQEYHIENGLTGFTIDCEGNILLELEGGSYYFRMVDGKGAQTQDTGYGNYMCNGKSYQVFNSTKNNPSIAAGAITIETSLTNGFGGLSLLKVMPDGSFFAVRSDVVSGVVLDKPIQVDDTVHYISADGEQWGVARVPVDERFYYLMRNLVVGPDGNVYCLLPTPDSLKILRLNFYKSLEPLIPGANMPTITLINSEALENQTAEMAPEAVATYSNLLRAQNYGEAYQ